MVKDTELELERRAGLSVGVVVESLGNFCQRLKGSYRKETLP